MSDNKPSFEVYGPRISILLKTVKLLKNHNFSASKKIFDTFITGVLLFLSFLLILSETVDIKNCHDLTTFAAHINPICFHLVGALKWCCGIRRVNIVEKLIQRLERCHQLSLKINDKDKGLHIERYNKKILKYQKQMATFAGVWLIMSICGVIQWCMNPIFYDFYNEFYEGIVINATARHLPYPGTFPWQIDTVAKYIFTFAFQLTGGIGCAIGHAVYETLNITLLASGCLQLEFLNESLTDETENRMILRNDLGLYMFEKKLKTCVRHHIEILEFLEELIDMSNYPMFIVCVDSTMALCLVAVEASTMEIDSSIECVMKLVSMAEYWTAITLDLFVYCYMATKIEELGLKVADTVYMCDWEQVSNIDRPNHRQGGQVLTKITQMVQICTMRAQKPILVTGGLFYILSLQTFKALVGFALSNALVLRQVSEEI